MAPNLKVSIIIVTWNGLEDLKICLPSIKEQSFQDFEVCIVDNGSVDGTQDYIKSLKDDRFFSVVLDKNYGFAMPNNIGYKSTKGKYVLALNNDIELETNFLDTAVNYLDTSSPELYAINPKIIYYYERDKINTVGIGILKNGNGYNIGKGEHINNYKKEIDVFGVCGGAAFYKRCVVDKLGYLFDESYFAYLEDLDLAIRAHLQGYKARYFPYAICYHKHSNTSKRLSFKKFYLIEKNRLTNLIKYYSRKYILLEWYWTLQSIRVSNELGKIDQKQKDFLNTKNIVLIIRIIVKSRIYVLLNLRKLIGYRWKNKLLNNIR